MFNVHSVLNPEFVPWYLCAPASLLLQAELRLPDVLVRADETLRAKADDLLLFGIHSLVARWIMGDTISSAQHKLDQGPTFSSATVRDFEQAAAPLPTTRASYIVILKGGAPTYWHMNGILSTLSSARLCRSLGRPVAVHAVPIKSAAACFYVLVDATTVRMVHISEWIICKAPRPECAHEMNPNYIPAEHTLSGQFEKGCKLGILMTDFWTQCIDSTDEVMEARTACECFHFGRNNYNPGSKKEIGIEAAGTHYYHTWFRDLKRSVQEREEAMVVNGSDVAEHFDHSVSSALDYFEPANLFVRWSLPPTAKFKSFCSGADWSMGMVRFLAKEQSLTSVVKAMHNAPKPFDLLLDGAAVTAPSSQVSAPSMDNDLAISALWMAYIGAPSLVAAVCVTESGRYNSNGNWSTRNVGTAFGFAIVRRIADSVFTDVVLSSSAAGGFRDAQLRAMRAPPTELYSDWKAAASFEIERASRYLLQSVEVASTHNSAQLFNLMDSLLCNSESNQQWRIGAEYVANKYSASETLDTLVKDFWRTDPDHRDYPGKRERRKKRGS